MKKIVNYLAMFCCLFILLQQNAQAKYSISEEWSLNLRSMIKLQCDKTTNLCQQLCDKENECIIKNSTCKDCISTGIKMTYFFSSFGKDIVASKTKVSSYEFIDFLKKGKFIGFSANNVYNQFDSVQSSALEARFKAMCPNSAESPMAFFEIENRELEIANAKYITCDDSIYQLEVKSVLLEE